ncbi:glycosyltransferase family 4 protein [Cystobacter fuscus]|uniref:glycosyltransferase family 4 protein n=1 Tax=Cystobacter fuscus TaxID=43 RepID=UPI002B280081|nr:glycosyltransferase family 4 protein [Cystobacter fuscus]
MTPPVQRVLMTTDAVSGVWTDSLELCRALAARGVRVDLALLGGPLSTAREMEARDVPGLVLHESPCQAEVWEAWLLELEEQLAPDIVHLHIASHGELAWKAPTLVVARTCPLSWGEALPGERSPERCAHHWWETTRGLRAAGCVVAPTSALLASVERHHGPFLSSRVIPPARRAEAFLPDAKEPFVFSSCRVWDGTKNLEALEAIAPRLSVPVRIAGQAPRTIQAESLGVLSEEELAGWMSRAAVFALPARYEPFGLSVLEAALAGCALVLGDLPSLREVWGDAALFVHPDDVEGLAQALRWLMSHPTERECRAHRARTRALTFSPRRMAEAYLELYATLRVQPVDSWARLLRAG